MSVPSSQHYIRGGSCRPFCPTRRLQSPAMSDKKQEHEGPPTIELIEHKTLAAALAAFQAEAPTAKKSSQGYGYKYASLAEILPEITPLLAKHGLSWSAKLGNDESGEYVLRYVLRHVDSGDQDADEIRLPVSKACKPQDLGSAVTYMRRYALQAHLNLVAEDDDGRAAQNAPRQHSQPQAAMRQTPLSDDARALIDAAAEGLPIGIVANAMLEASGGLRRSWDSDDEAQDWKDRAIVRFPAARRDALLGILKREKTAFAANEEQPEPTIPFEIGSDS